MANHQEPDGLEPQLTCESEVLNRHVGLGAVGGDPADLTTVVLCGPDVVLGAETRQHQERDLGLLRRLRGGLDQLLLRGFGEAVVERRPAQTVAVGHLDDRNTGVVEGSDDRAHLVLGELMTLVVAAVAQRRVGDADVERVGVLAGVCHQIHCCRAHAGTPNFCFAISSPTLVAAAVMMSRLPAYGGRKSPAPSTSTKIDTRA